VTPSQTDDSGIATRWLRSRLLLGTVVAVVAIAAVVSAVLATGGASLTTRDRYWQQDIAYLATQLPRVHVDGLTGGTTRARWNAAADRLKATVAQLTNGQIITGMARIVAQLHDDETAIEVPTDPLYPFQTQWIGAGLYFIAVPAADRALLGGRLLAVDGHPIAQVLAAIRSTVDYEDAGVARGMESQLVENPAWLSYLGLVSSIRSARFTVALPSGRVVSADIDSYGADGGLHGKPDDVTVPLPLYLQRNNQPYWMKVLAARDAVYLKYNQCLDTDGFQRLAARALALLRVHPAWRLIIDLRFNGGGDSSPLQTVADRIAADPAIDQHGRIFGLIDGNVYSSASLDSYLLQSQDGAILIGQPTAEQRDTFGNDEGRLSLPHYGITVQYTTAVVNKAGAVYGVPDLTVAPTLRDWLTGTDPVLAAALAYKH
jgi:Peptidase family S41